MEEKDRFVVSGRNIYIAIVFVITITTHVISPGRYLNGRWRVLYSSYFSDIAIPFCFYYIVSIAKRQKIPRTNISYCCFVILVCCAAELGQYWGLPILGRTFDPLDLLMYALGSISALLIDSALFGRRKRQDRY